MSEVAALSRRISHVFLDAVVGVEVSREQADDDGTAIVTALQDLERLGAVTFIRPEGSQDWQVDLTAVCAGALNVLYWLTTTLATAADTDLSSVIASARQNVLDRQADQGEEQPWA